LKLTVRQAIAIFIRCALFLQLPFKFDVWALYFYQIQSPQAPDGNAFFYGIWPGVVEILCSWRFLLLLSAIAAFFRAGTVAALLNKVDEPLAPGSDLSGLVRTVLQAVGIWIFIVRVPSLAMAVQEFIEAGAAGMPRFQYEAITLLDPLQVLLSILAGLLLMAYPGLWSRLLTFSGPKAAPSTPAPDLPPLPGRPGVPPLLVHAPPSADAGMGLVLGGLAYLLFIFLVVTGLWMARYPIRDFPLAARIISHWQRSVAQPLSYKAKVAPPGFSEQSLAAKVLLSGGEQGACPGQLSAPSGLAVLPQGDVYVADLGNGRVSVFTDQGVYKFSFGVPGKTPGKGKPGEFNEPSGVAIGPDGVVYVCDTWNARIQKFNSEGAFLGSIGRPGDLYSPRNVAVDRAGMVYVADTGHSQVKVYDSAGVYKECFGGKGDQPGDLNEVFGLAVNSKGEIFLADPGNQLIHKYSAYPQIGLECDAIVPGWDVTRPNWPMLAIDAKDNVYLSDGQSFRILVYDSDLNYRGTISSHGTDIPYQARGIAFNNMGDLWIADTGTNRIHRIGEFGALGPPETIRWDPNPTLFPPASNNVHELLGANAPIPRDDFLERGDFIDRNFLTLFYGKYRDLESQAADLRTGKQVFDNGDSKIIWFYTGLSDGRQGGIGWGSDYYEDRLKKAALWAGQYPDSVTAKLFTAQLLLDAAMPDKRQTRVYSEGNDDPKSDHARVQKAWDLLEEVAGRPEALADPEYYCLRLRAGLADGRPREELAKWYHMGRGACPGAWEISSMYVTCISYKNGGGNLLPAFFRDFALQEPVQALYVAAYDDDNSFTELGDIGTPWDKFAPDRETYWNELLDGARMAAAKFPTSSITLSRIAKVAANTGHYKDAAPFFRLLGGRHENYVWRSNHRYFSTKARCLQESGGS
jgi:streptogramin lyase